MRSRLISIIRKEFIQIFRDPRTLVLIIIMPIMQLFLLGYAARAAITDEKTTDNPNRNPNQYGEYMGLAAQGGKAYLAWVDSRHFYPGTSTNTQKENVGVAVIEFTDGGGAVCGNNLLESGEVCDGTDLGGQTCVGLGFTGGTLACNGTCSAFVTSGCTSDPTPTTTTFTSVAAEDGYVRESSETSNAGGTVSSTASTTSAIRVGDDNQDRQYKDFVSFDTASIPDGARSRPQAARP